jgi:hypothetical protein
VKLDGGTLREGEDFEGCIAAIEDGRAEPMLS